MLIQTSVSKLASTCAVPPFLFAEPAVTIDAFVAFQAAASNPVTQDQRSQLKLDWLDSNAFDDADRGIHCAILCQNYQHCSSYTYDMRTGVRQAAWDKAKQPTLHACVPGPQLLQFHGPHLPHSLPACIYVCACRCAI